MSEKRRGRRAACSCSGQETAGVQLIDGVQMIG